MTEPPDQMPAATGRGHLRASHADREQVIEALKGAFVHGRLTRDELDLRVGRALAALTYADLAALTTDIPGAPAPAPRVPPAGARRRPLARAAAGSGGCLVIAFGAGQLIHLADPGATPGSIPKALIGPLFLLAFSAVIAALAILGCGVAASVGQRGSHTQLPPGRAPGTRGQASPRPPSPHPGRQLPPVDPGPRHTEAARSRRPWASLPGSGHCADGALAGSLPGNDQIIMGAP